MERHDISMLAVDIAVRSEELKPVVMVVGGASCGRSMKKAIKAMGSFSDVYLTSSGLVGKATMAFKSYGELDISCTMEDDKKEQSIDYNVNKNKFKWMK
jgi:hypothetical protein